MPSRLRVALSESKKKPAPQAFVKVDLEGIEDLIGDLRSLAAAVEDGQAQSSEDSERATKTVIASIDMIGERLLRAIQEIPQVEMPEFPVMEKPAQVDLAPVLDALDEIGALLRRKPAKKKARYEFVIERDEDGLIESVLAIGE